MQGQESFRLNGLETGLNMYKNKTERTLLIDGDTILYPTAAKGEAEELELDEMLEMCMAKIYKIQRACHADEYKFIVSGRNNFRKVLHPDYKAGRPPKPKDYTTLSLALQSSLIDKWYFHPQLEADDLLGIIATNRRVKNPIICTIDKDLLQIEGWHYNFYGEGDAFPHYQSKEEADHFWTQQLLTGDSTDNIHGMKGIGPVKARKLISQYKDEAGLPYGAELAKYIYEKEEIDLAVYRKTLELVTIWKAPMPSELKQNELITEVIKTIGSLNDEEA